MRSEQGECTRPSISRPLLPDVPSNIYKLSRWEPVIGCEVEHIHTYIMPVYQNDLRLEIWHLLVVGGAGRLVPIYLEIELRNYFHRIRHVNLSNESSAATCMYIPVNNSLHKDHPAMDVHQDSILVFDSEIYLKSNTTSLRPLIELHRGRSWLT